jgi:hypothetical protein
MHRDFHEDHPGNRHDHRYNGRWGYGGWGS